MHTPSPYRVTFALALCALLSLPVFAESHARIVRLSDVQGAVQMDKNTGLGFEKAFVNLPVVQGSQLRTGANGRAEIEFEDGSSVRLGPNSAVEFSSLGLNDSGKRVSELKLTEGLAYVNWLGKDDFSLNFSQEKLALDHSAHFRVDTSTQVANVAVFKGDVQVSGPGGQVSVEKKKTATFDVADNDKSAINNKIAEAPLDSWDKEAISYHDQYAKNNSNSPYGYGLSDLNYYGAYSNVPGYGMMWQPYFAGVGWDPFMDGAWGFYPGYGYMFASAYPWGWLPYRYGNWMFIPGNGWMWQPGMWTSFVTVPRYTPTTLTHVSALTPPAAGTMKTFTVGRVGTSSTMMTSRMTVNAGSAGMGIQRGSLNNLNHLNHQVVKSGSAEVRPAPQFSATPAGRSTAASGGRPSGGGYAPARSGGSMPASAGHSAPASHGGASGPVHH